MDNSPPVRRDFYGIITNSRGDQILLLKHKAGWALPHWESLQALTVSSFTPDILASVRQHYGWDTVMLKEYHKQRIFEGNYLRAIERVVVLEYRAGSTDRNGAGWVDLDALGHIHFAVPLHKELAQKWLNENSGDFVPAHRAAWAKPGWFDKVSRWILNFVTLQGWELTGPIEQRRANAIAAQLLIPTSAGKLYLKALPPYAKNEAVFGPLMEKVLPGQVPHILQTEVTEGWLLTADFKGASLADNADPAVWEAALREFAALQIKCAAHIEQFLEAGAGDRRLEKLGGQLATALARDDLWQMDEPNGLSRSELAALRAALPRLQAMCDELASFGLPASLDSGDFHPENVAVTSSGFVFYDWSEMVVTHPFFSLNAFEEYLNRFSPQKLDWQKLVQAYLEPWQALLPSVQLTQAYQLAYKLGHAVQMLAYIWIHDGIEPEDYDGIDPLFIHYAKALLAVLKSG